MITPTPHEKREWSRFAQALYAAGRTSVGHRYSVAAAWPADTFLTPEMYDGLMGDYRSWLIGDLKLAA